MAKLSAGSADCNCGRGRHETTFVVVTGGPGAGKTAVLEMARRSFCRHVGVLPESAGIIFGGGFPRHEGEAGRRAAQRAIFHVQHELEVLVREESRFAVALCDRGTLDGIAYWPGELERYWEQLATTLSEQVDRYATVIHLETPSKRDGYNRDNSLRVESAEQAAILDGRIKQAWAMHPRRFVVPSRSSFEEKAQAALGIIRAELPVCCHGHEIVSHKPAREDS